MKWKILNIIFHILGYFCVTFFFYLEAPEFLRSYVWLIVLALYAIGFTIEKICDHYKAKNIHKKSKKSEYGKLRIEYKTQDNVIQVYKNRTDFYLLINGRKKAEGNNMFTVYKLRIKSEIETEEKTIPVEAVVTIRRISLYYDGELVAKTR